jgi:hypothetical protein
MPPAEIAKKHRDIPKNDLTCRLFVLGVECQAYLLRWMRIAPPDQPLDLPSPPETANPPKGGDAKPWAYRGPSRIAIGCQVAEGRFGLSL